jgi:predicted exporter
MVVYRCWRILVLSLIPLLTGLVTGALAIRLEYGAIHAITLGFGSTLLGVAADYPNHFFTHLNPNLSNQTTMQRLWPTLRLGILTNVAGFGVMFFSGFRGLQEIGIFASAGLIGAGLSTRFILPQLSPPSSGVGTWMATLSHNPIQKLSRSKRLQFCVLVPIILGLFFAVSGRSLFNDDLATLNPVNPSQLESDLQLQRAFRVPDMRWLVLVTGATEEDALARSENLKPVLTELLAAQAMTGFDLVSDVLPSQKTQSLRNDALPTPDAAMQALEKALRGTPFKTHAFSPLIDDLSLYSRLPPLTHETLKGTLLEPRVNAEIFNTPEGTAIVVPIEGITRIATIQAGLRSLEDPQIQLVDLQDAMTQRIRENRTEASRLLLGGLLTIFVILAVGLRSLGKAGRVMAPMLLASLSTGLLLAILSHGLNIYHLASILLVMGLSLDQALFFNRPCVDPDERAKTHLSILLCSLSSILAFGGLAFASVPLLSAIGTTVSIGAFLAVTFAALLAK